MGKTKFRGAQISPSFLPGDISALTLHKPNLVRFQFIGDLFEAALMKFEEYLAESTIPTVLAYFRPQGNPVTSVSDKNLFKLHWGTLLSLYKNHPKIEAFDILNEPRGTTYDVTEFMQEMYSYIRERTTKKICITCRTSDPVQFSKTWHAGNDDNVWYEVHMYLPMSVTHQGIDGRPTGKLYPTLRINRSVLRTLLDGVRAFQLKYHARIYVGEFGISTFADENVRQFYMRDCMELFEEYGWNWTYHAWREAPVWNIEGTPAGVRVFKAWEKNA